MSVKVFKKKVKHIEFFFNIVLDDVERGEPVLSGLFAVALD